MARYNPLVSFHFVVKGLGTGESGDTAFRDVTGLTVQFQGDPLSQGGDHNTTHVLPSQVKYGDITLKRGVMAADAGAELVRWLKNAFENTVFEPKDLLIQLLNESRSPVVQWKVIHALPKSWKFSDLNAERGEVFIESIELSINKFIYQKL